MASNTTIIISIIILLIIGAIIVGIIIYNNKKNPPPQPTPPPQPPPPQPPTPQPTPCSQSEYSQYGMIPPYNWGSAPDNVVIADIATCGSQWSSASLIQKYGASLPDNFGTAPSAIQTFITNNPPTCADISHVYNVNLGSLDLTNTPQWIIEYLVSHSQ